jgi:BirA family biotin operon repressor/biotin-[acetyl-CoA-carboxylase] ligase
MATHYDIVHLTEVASTQDEASRRFDMSSKPTVVLADRQFAGRGRQGRSWEQADRAMFASYAHATVWPVSTRPLIPLVCGLAMREAIADISHVAVDLKWPNDLLIGDRKLGGILVEASGVRVTSGCGVNLWWDDLPEHAASLYNADPGPGKAAELADAWAGRLVHHFDKGPGGWSRDEYISASVTLGHPITWDGGTGTAVELAADGALVVSTDDGTVTIHAGDIHTQR